jgi:hypothetical protein
LIELITGLLPLILVQTHLDAVQLEVVDNCFARHAVIATASALFLIFQIQHIVLGDLPRRKVTDIPAVHNWMIFSVCAANAVAAAQPLFVHVKVHIIALKNSKGFECVALIS